MFNSPETLGGFVTLEHDDRRLFRRKRVEGHIDGRRLKKICPPGEGPTVRLQLRDISVSGVSGWFSVALGRGEALTLVLPPDGIQVGHQITGRVVRCEQSAYGYRVAVSFDKNLGE